jgi:hypothetical protein
LSWDITDELADGINFKRTDDTDSNYPNLQTTFIDVPFLLPTRPS